MTAGSCAMLGIVSPLSPSCRDADLMLFREFRPEEPDMFERSRSNRLPATAGDSRTGCLVGVTSLVDNSVYDARGNLVGKLEELVIDSRTGCVRHAVLAVGGILGIGRRRFAVPWSTLNPDANYRRCVVDVTQMQLTAVRVPDNDPWLRGMDSARAGEGVARPSRLFGAKA